MEERPAKAIFGAALELPRDQRGPFLDEACAGDPGLRREIDRLLEAHGRADGFLGSPTQGGGGEDGPQPGMAASERAGAVVGRYRLMQPIGEGGFGVVFLAEQEAPIRRRVAFKIIKPGMDSRQVTARFEQERQALALMDHPSIARVFDAGTTDLGRPYFVMELVDGEPITAYCDRGGLGVRRRLELMREVCHAVQHAHQKGIIHRDLKPSNVMVTVADGRAVPKIIDFGIAKATTGQLTGAAEFTEVWQLIGTPAYMSPEQAGIGGPAGADVDTRSDIYSLGVLLYELLTGSPPFDPERLRSAEWEELRRIIREEEPLKPSTRLRTLEGGAGGGAVPGGLPALRSASAVRGDLDWIVMKCLEKDRSRRYETADALAMDIARHLAGDPVLAAPPSRMYRVGKLLRRRRREVAAAGIVAASLVGAVVGTGTFALRESRQRALAEQRADEIDQVVAFQERMLSGFDVAQMGRWMRQDVLDEAERTWRSGASEEQVAERRAELESLLEGANFTNPAIRMLDRTIFERALSALDTEFEDQPLVRATLLQNIALTLRQLSMPERASGPQDAALKIREAALGPDDPRTLQAMCGSAWVLGERGRWREALPVAERALEASLRVLGEDDVRTLQCRALLGTVHFRLREWERCEAQRRAVFEGYRRALGENDERTINAGLHLGQALMWLDRHEEAEERFLSALALSPDDHPNESCGLMYLGMLRRFQERLPESEELLRRAVALRRGLLGDGDSDVNFVLNQIGSLHLARGEWSAAETRFREVLDTRRRNLGDAHPLTNQSFESLAAALIEQGKFDEAEVHLRRALAGPELIPGQSLVPETMPLARMGQLRMRQDRAAEAEPYFRESLTLRAAAAGAEALVTLHAERELAEAVLRLGRLEEAEERLIRALAGFRGTTTPYGLAQAMWCEAALAALRRAQGRPAEAGAHLRAALDGLRQLRGDGHGDVLEVSIDLADLLNAQDRHREAADLLGHLVPEAGAAPTEPQARWLGDLLLALGTARMGLGDWPGAEAALSEARQALARIYGEHHGRTARCTAELIRLYERWHAADPAGGHDADAARWRGKGEPGQRAP